MVNVLSMRFGERVNFIAVFFLVLIKIRTTNYNKAGYTATPVACGWAGAIMEVTRSFGREQQCQKPKTLKQVTRGHNIVADGWAGAANPPSNTDTYTKSF